MQAFMPQKDTSLELSNAARSFIYAYNASSPCGGPGLFPRFPLYAFADVFPEGGFSSCSISAPQQDGESFFFPVELTCGDGQPVSLRIVFAELDRPAGNSPQPLPNFPGREAFPLLPRVFRTGRIEMQGGSWEVWDERWHKLAGKPPAR